jgi:hypothetical protein
MWRTWIVAALAAGVLGAGPAQAQQALFADESNIAFTLNAPWDTLIRRASDSTEPVEGQIALAGGGAYPLKIAPRGFTRRKGDICNFPPLKLDMDKPAMAGTLFEGQNKLKLVTQCRPSERYEQMLVREYTVYRLFNAVTPQSFRVRPATVTYRDTEGKREDITRFAFLIEDADAMGRRVDLSEIEVGARELNSAQIDAAALARFALFQFVVGNLDWEYFAGPAGDSCCHNAKLIGPKAARTNIIPVPYDFDFSALVGAPYASPPAGVTVSSAHERYYRGHCRANVHVPAAAAQLLEKRAAFAQIIAGEARLSTGSKRLMQDYLDDSFAILADSRRLDREITSHCR